MPRERKFIRVPSSSSLPTVQCCNCGTLVYGPVESVMKHRCHPTLCLPDNPCADISDELYPDLLEEFRDASTDNETDSEYSDSED